MKIYILDIVNDLNCIDRIEHYPISIARRKRIQDLKFDIDKKILLLSELLAKKALSDALGEKTKIEFKFHQHGKPYINGSENLEFSVAHTRSTIIVAVATGVNPLGVDIESIRLPKEYLSLTVNYSNAEQLYLVEDYSIERFVEIWTKKEAFLKTVGIGLADGILSLFSVLDKTFFTLQRKNEFIALYSDDLKKSENVEIVMVSEDELLNKYAKK